MDAQLFANNLHQRVIQECTYRWNPPFKSINYTAKGTTRAAIFQNFRWWIADTKCSTKFQWVTGPIGVGKTCIAREVARDANWEGQLAGDFFFRWSLQAGVGRTLKGFSATISYRLARWFIEPGMAIAKVLEADPDVLLASEDDQWDALVIKPLESVTFQPPYRPVFIIDGLDACHSHAEQSWVLQKLVQLCQRYPVVVILFSRPEEHIITEISSLQRNHPSLFRTHLVLGDTEDARRDILELLSDVKPGNDYNAHFLETWDDLTSRILTDAAGQLFYVEILVEYQQRRIGELESSYDVLSANLEHQADTFTSLDKVYDAFMVNAFSCLTDHQASVVRLVFYHLLYIQHPDSIDGISMFWSKPATDLRSVLRKFESVLRLPMADSMPLSFHHPSFALFLASPFRGGNGHHHRVSEHYLLVEALERSLELASSSQAQNRPLGMASLWLSLAPEIRIPDLDDSSRMRVIRCLDDFDIWSWMSIFYLLPSSSDETAPSYATFYDWLRVLNEGSILMKYPAETPEDVRRSFERGFVSSLLIASISALAWVTSISVVKILILPPWMVVHVILHLFPSLWKISRLIIVNFWQITRTFSRAILGL